MQTFPNAKINLGLNIVSKRPDGYHNLETVFYPIKALHDVMNCNQINPLETKSENNKQIACRDIIRWQCADYAFSSDGIYVSGDIESNLIIKALRLIKQDYQIPFLDIAFTKNIPFGAGLGGGSADAAFMLKTLNEMFQLGLSNKALEMYASRLGADCPVFIENKAVYAEGIGNVFSPIQLDLSDYYLVLVKPDIHVSTATAYSMVKPMPATYHLKEAILQPVSTWKNLIKNDFEDSVFPKFPAIADIKSKLYDTGAFYASMSGSGSSVFGLFQQPTNLATHFPGSFVFEGRM